MSCRRCVKLSGAPLPANYPGDGLSLSPVLFKKGTRNKEFVFLKYDAKICLRNIDVGIIPQRKKGYQLLKYNGPYDSEPVDPANLLEKDRAFIENLQKFYEGFNH